MSGFGAKDEIRTRDPDLGKVVLYQLSYFRIGDGKSKIKSFSSKDFLSKKIILQVNA